MDWVTLLWNNSSLPNPLVCLELNQQAAVPVLSEFSYTDCGCFACPVQSARQRLAELSTANPLPRTCL